ncbi:MAG: SDR family NAD(P)-dependent oxidoreductase, partial [Pseudomonadota bacterium]
MTMMTAIVTGAGSGIGQAIALRLAADGYNVLVNDFRLEAAQATAAQIGAKAVAIGGDVSSEADVAAMVAAAESAFGPVTHLINCAGHVHQGKFTDLTVGDFDRMIAVHLRGTFLCTHAVLKGMLARGSG